MKDFDKLTNEEISNLTDEQIAIYKKLCWAQHGIKFPIKPNEPECVEEEKPDLTAYYINELGQERLFLSLEEAKEVVSVLNKCKSYGRQDYNRSVGYSQKFFQPGFERNYYGNEEKSLTIQSIQIYSKELFNSMVTNLQINNKLREQYQKDKSEYEKVLSTATELTAEMDEKILAVRSDFERKRSLTYKFREDYLPLAENNEEVAMNFLAKAYTLSEEDKEYILANYKNEDGKE